MANVPPIEQRYRPSNNYPDAVFVNASRETSFSRVSVPAYVTIGGFVAVGTVCLTLGMGYMSLINKIDQVPAMVKVQLENITKDFGIRMDWQSQRVDRIESEIDRRTQDRFTLTDHNRWCQTAELVNTGTGWKCPDVERSRLEYAPKLKGWQTAPKGDRK
jgi:hypothetical protein